MEAIDICFSADSRERVDERAAWAREVVFLHDPDGIKLEILHRPRADSGQ